MQSAGSQASLLRIGQDDKFYCKLLSKESSADSPSFRVYYGGASGAVPFRWETQPGTPKHPTQASHLPSPLTPPPSYLSSPRRARSCRVSPSTPSLLRAILPRLAQMTARRSPSSPRGSLSCSSVSSSSGASSTSFSPLGSSAGHPGSRRRRRRRFSSSKWSFSSMGDEDEPGAGSSPTSTLCFGTPDRDDRPRGRYKMVFVKDALLSVVGRGSGRHSA